MDKLLNSLVKCSLIIVNSKIEFYFVLRFLIQKRVLGKVKCEAIKIYIRT